MKQNKQGKLAPAEAVAAPAHVVDAEADFIKVERDIATIGFFTPTSKKTLKKPRVKTVRVNRTGEDGRTVENTVRIVTGGDYGLPGTADFDKFLALMKLLTAAARRGVVENPVSFTSWELLSLLGVHVKSGKNYEGVGEWLDRMCATTMEVIGKGEAGGIEAFGKDRGIQVFERAVSFGRELERGVIADRNFVWLAEWQLKAINEGNLIPIDFEMYRSLRNPIAKALYPLLVVWLYASRAEEVFTKRYDELCQLLGIKEYPNKSLIEQKLGPSLRELTKIEFLAGWGIERTRGATGFKVIFRHGPKFHRDRLAQGARREQLPAGASTRSDHDAELVEMLAARGVMKHVAQQLVAGRAPGQFIEDQIEWTDFQISRRGAHRYRNPPGLYVTIIRENTPIDPNFETSRMRRLRAEYEAQALTVERESPDAADVAESAASAGEETPRAPNDHDLYLLRCRYDDYVKRAKQAHIEGLPPAERETLIERAREQYRERYREAAKIFKGEAADGIILGIAEELAAPDVDVMTFEDFAAAQGAGASGA